MPLRWRRRRAVESLFRISCENPTAFKNEADRENGEGMEHFSRCRCRRSPRCGQASLPARQSNVGVGNDQQSADVATNMRVLAVLTVTRLRPIVMATSFVRIVVAIRLLRSTLSRQNARQSGSCCTVAVS